LHSHQAAGGDEDQPERADGAEPGGDEESQVPIRPWWRRFLRTCASLAAETESVRADLDGERAAHRQSQAHLRALQQKLDGLTRDVNRVGRELERDRGVLMQMGEYYPAVYRDSLELTYHIGKTRDEDRVTERRCTRPKPALPFMLLCPTVPTPRDRRVPFDQIGFQVGHDFGEVGTIRCILLEDAPQPIKYMICFSPSIREWVGWTIHYRMPGLWDELRGSEHEDHLTWTAVDRQADHAATTNLVHLTVNFVFPAGMGNPVVVQKFDRGSLTGPIQTADGLTLIRWDCPQPAPVSFQWLLRLEPDERQHGASIQ
jgi:hypothetical protein